LVLGVFATISIIIKISTFYRLRYRFSIWSGVFFLLIVIVFLLLGAYSTGISSNILVISSATLCIFTIIQDIRLSNTTHGLLGFCFQVVLVLLLLFILLMMLVHGIANIVVHKTRSLTKPNVGIVQEMRYAIILFPVFIRI